MDGQALNNDARLDSNEPRSYKACGYPQSQSEVKVFEDARVEEKNGVFGDCHGYRVDGLVNVAEKAISTKTPPAEGRYGD